MLAAQALMPLELDSAVATLERSDWLRGTVRLFAWYAQGENPARLDLLRMALDYREREAPLYRRRIEKAWGVFSASKARRGGGPNGKRWR